MIHAKFGTSTSNWGKEIDFHCVACEAFVARERAEFLDWLVINKDQVFCGDCDPMPDTVPTVLGGNGQVLACLSVHYSTIP